MILCGFVLALLLPSSATIVGHRIEHSTQRQRPDAALMSAVERLDVAAVERILASGVPPTGSHVSRMLRAREGDTEGQRTMRDPIRLRILGLFFEHGMEPHECSFSIVRGGSAAMVEMLYRKIGMLVQKPGWMPPYVEHDAIAFNDVSVVRLFLSRGADPNLPCKDRKLGKYFPDAIGYPLHVAAYARKADTVEALIEAGADVNLRDPDGETPLHSAVLSANNAAVIKLLLARGADPSLRTGPDPSIHYKPEMLYYIIMKSGYRLSSGHAYYREENRAEREELVQRIAPVLFETPLDIARRKKGYESNVEALTGR